jgi:hypothetical protein
MVCNFCLLNREEGLTIKKKHCFQRSDCFLHGMNYSFEMERKWHLSYLPNGYIDILVIEQYYLSEFERYRKTIRGGDTKYEHFYKIKTSEGYVVEFCEEVSIDKYQERIKEKHGLITKFRYCYDKTESLIIDSIDGKDGYYCEQEFSNYDDFRKNIVCPLDKDAKEIRVSNYFISIEGEKNVEKEKQKINEKDAKN